MSLNKVYLIFYFYLLKFGLVYSQWNHALPYPKKTSTNTLSLPVQYVPVSSLTNQDRPTSYRQCDPFANGPFPYNPYYQNYPGEAEVGLLQSSYPGQPVIVINNGDSGYCNRREREFDIEELLTLMFAVGGHGRHHHHKSEIEIPREEPALPRNPPPYPYYGFPGFGMQGDDPEKMKPRESPKASKINITIVLPSTISSTNVQVENQTKEEKKSNEEIDEANK